MRPPECALCGVEKDCDLVYFKKRKRDEAWEKRMERIKGVGHPPWVEWFCKEHIARARALKYLSIGKGMNILRHEYSKKQ
jgi:hypothetical protein